MISTIRTHVVRKKTRQNGEFVFVVFFFLSTFFIIVQYAILIFKKHRKFIAASEVPDVESGGFEEQRARAQIAKWLKEPVPCLLSPLQSQVLGRHSQKMHGLWGKKGLSPTMNLIIRCSACSMNVSEAPEGHATPRDVDFRVAGDLL